MVYCTKCGANNPDDAKVCAKCGAPLYPTREHEPYRRFEEECFGIPWGGTIVALAIGVVIVFGGLIWILQQAGLIPEAVSIWPFAVIILGILIIISAVYGLRRRY